MVKVSVCFEEILYSLSVREYAYFCNHVLTIYFRTYLVNEQEFVSIMTETDA